MTDFERQEVTGRLMRMVDDAHYNLSLALFKFHTTASYFDEIPASCFVEVETAMREAEDVLSKCRAMIATFVAWET